MKKLIKWGMIVFLCLTAFPVFTATYAAEKDQDGIVVELLTDKSEYENGEEVQIELSVTNKNEYPININHIENTLPEGFVLSENEIDKLENKVLNPNETIHLHNKIEKRQAEIILNENDKLNPIKNTSDKEQNQMWLILIVLGSGASYFILKKKKGKVLLPTLLIVSGVSGAFKIDTVHANTVNTINITHTIKYDNTSVNLNSKIAYNIMNDHNPNDPVVYQNGITEYRSEFKNNDVNQIITVYNSDLKFEIGKIYVIKSNDESGIVIKVEKIISSNDKIDVQYSVPKFSEVIQTINYVGEETDDITITPAEGIVFNEDSANENNPSLARFGINGSDSIQLDKHKNFKFNIDDLEVSGSLGIDKINYDLNVSCDLFGCDIKRAYTTLDASLEVDAKGEKEFIGDRRIKLAEFVSPIGNGFFAEGNLYAYFNSKGSGSIEYTINATGGFDYKKGKLKGIWELDNELKKANVNANIGLGFILEPKIDFLNLGLISAEFELGRTYEIDVDTISLAPYKYCLDAGYYNHSSITTILLPGLWDKKFTDKLTDKDNTSIKSYGHFEENGFVDECTRKYGDLKGFIHKQDGTESLPLIYAEIILSKEGKIVDSVKSGSNGYFSFNKIKKGKYDVIVRSNYYETYKGKTEVKGGKETDLGIILLKPYADSVIVKGKIYDSKTKEGIAEAEVSVDGYADRTVITDDAGYYSLEVPKGNHKINVNAKNYASNTYQSDFTIDRDQLDIGLDKQYDYKVLTINPGESYELNFKKSKNIYVIFDKDTEYSAAFDSNLVYHAQEEAKTEFWSPVNNGSHWEIKVYSGLLTVFVSEDFDMGPCEDLTNYADYNNLNGLEPLIAYELTAGQTITFDNQNDDFGTIRYYAYSNDVSFKETCENYYYTNHFGWDPDIEVIEESGKQNFWSYIGGLSRVTFEIKSGSLTLYFYRREKLTVY